MKRRRTTRRSHFPMGLICAALVSVLCTLGVGYASWTDGIVIRGVVRTGTMNVDFVDCKVTGSKHNDVVAYPTDGDSRIVITAVNQDKSLNLVLHYSVKNTGTIPVEFMGIESYDDTFDVKYPGGHSEPGRHRNKINPGETMRDTVIIRFRDGFDPEPDTSYTLSFGLNFCQWAGES